MMKIASMPDKIIEINNALSEITGKNINVNFLLDGNNADTKKMEYNNTGFVEKARNISNALNIPFNIIDE